MQIKWPLKTFIAFYLRYKKWHINDKTSTQGVKIKFATSQKIPSEN